MGFEPSTFPCKKAPCLSLVRNTLPMPPPVLPLCNAYKLLYKLCNAINLLVFKWYVPNYVMVMFTSPIYTLPCLQLWFMGAIYNVRLKVNILFVE